MAVGCVVQPALSRDPAPESNAAPSLDEQLTLGAELYDQSCAICHFDGAGNSAAPDLKGSPYWKDGPAKMISLIIKGQSNVSVVNGKKFNGEMPPMAYLTDDEVAAVTAYLFATFADKKEAIDPATVAPLRK